MHIAANYLCPADMRESVNVDNDVCGLAVLCMVYNAGKVKN